jgi:hypothetical protein
MNRFHRGRVIVQWVALGEGLCGDYNPDDPDDIEYLRFDILTIDNAGCETPVDDASYCTLMPVSASDDDKRDALITIMDHVYSKVIRGESIKRLCQQLSYISPV